MANGVNIKMGVSGIAQFKQNMNVAKNSVKTLDEALKLNEKQIKATGDAEEYMKTKSELLKKKIEEQKAIASQAEKALDAMTRNGVDKASKSFQDMQQAMLRAKGAALDAQGELDNVGSAAADVSAEVGDMNGSLQSIGKQISFKTVTEGIDTITGGLEKAARKAWEIGSQLVRNTLGGGSWADELDTEAAKLEISPEQLYRMRQTADIIDTSAEAIAGAQNRMKKVLDGGGSGIADVLQELGLSTAIETDPAEEFWKIGEALMAMGDAYDKEGTAQKIFGKSWRELLPLFQAGREEYEETMKSWSWVGDDSFNSLLKMDDQYQKLQNEWETFQHTMEAALAGPMTEGMETLTGLVKEFNKYLESDKGQEMLQKLGDTVSGLLGNLTNIDPEKVMEDFQGAFDAIIGGLKWLDENKDSVVKWLEAIVIGWGALKLTGGALQIINMINGIQGLSGTAGIASAGAAAGSSWASSFASAAMTAAPFLAFLYTLFDTEGNVPFSGSRDKEHITDFFDKDGKLRQWAKDEGYWVDDNGDIRNNEEEIAQEQRANEARINAMGQTNVETTGQSIYKLRRPGGASQYLDDLLTEEQRQAAERFWDEYRRNPSDDETVDNAMAALEQAFVGNEDLFDKLNDLINDYVTRNNDADQWRLERDIPDEIWGHSTRSNAGNSELPSAINNLNGLPGSISKAVITGMDGIRLYIDGQAAGRIIGPWMRQDMADLVLEMTQ